MEGIRLTSPISRAQVSPVMIPTPGIVLSNSTRWASSGCPNRPRISRRSSCCRLSRPLRLSLNSCTTESGTPSSSLISSRKYLCPCNFLLL